VSRTNPSAGRSVEEMELGGVAGALCADADHESVPSSRAMDVRVNDI